MRKVLCWLVVAAALLIAGARTSAAADAVLAEKEWRVDGVVRKAFVYIPAAGAKVDAPLVFAFHGHGGTMRSASIGFGCHKLWPEAVVVYMQGLPTAGMTDPEGKRAGWQKSIGDQADRDLKFFDEVLATLKKENKIDEKRIYVTGHSNGGQFTYLLWAARGDVFAAVAPSAGFIVRDFRVLKPKPALHVAGEQDEIVPFESQKRVMSLVRRLNGCDAEGQPWAKAGSIVGTEYRSKSGTPFVSLVYPGTHRLPVEAPELIVRFFKEHPGK